MHKSLEGLDRASRLRLMQFVCSFAWADFEIRDEEREFVARMVRRLELDAEDKARVTLWLETPPSADELDPASIPAEHRQLFLQVMEQVVTADDDVATEELESLEVLRQLLETRPVAS